MGINANDRFWLFGRDFTTICVRKPTRNRLNTVVDSVNANKDSGRRVSVNFLLEYCLEHVFNKEEFMTQFQQVAEANQ